MAEKWYQKTPVQVAIVGAVIAGLFGILSTILPGLLQKNNESAEVLQPVWMPIPSKERLIEEQFSLKVQSIENRSDAAMITITPPDGPEQNVGEVTAVGRLDYKHKSQTYFIHILRVEKNGGRISRIRLSVAKKL